MKRDSFMQTAGTFPLCQVANISDVIKHICQDVSVPEKILSLFIVVGYDASLITKPAGGRVSFLIKNPYDCPYSKSLRTHHEDFFHNRSCLRINDQVVFICWILQITVWRIVANVFSFDSFHLQCRTGFAGDIFGINIVYHVF